MWRSPSRPNSLEAAPLQAAKHLSRGGWPGAAVAWALPPTERKEAVPTQLRVPAPPCRLSPQ